MRQSGSLGYLFKKEQYLQNGKTVTRFSEVGIPYRYHTIEKRNTNVDMSLGIRKTGTSVMQVSLTQIPFENGDRVSNNSDGTDYGQIVNLVSKTAIGRGRMHRKKTQKEYTFEVS